MNDTPGRCMYGKDPLYNPHNFQVTAIGSPTLDAIILCCSKCGMSFGLNKLGGWMSIEFSDFTMKETLASRAQTGEK